MNETFANILRAPTHKQLQACSSESSLTVTTCGCSSRAKHHSCSEPRLRVMCLALHRADNMSRKRNSCCRLQACLERSAQSNSKIASFRLAPLRRCGRAELSDLDLCSSHRQSTAYAHGGDSTAPHWPVETLQKNPVTQETDVACFSASSSGTLIGSWPPGHRGPIAARDRAWSERSAQPRKKLAATSIP